MKRALRLGAVAYDPKVVPIWDGIRDFINEKGPAMDYVLFSNYETQVDALIEGFIDIAWNTNLAYVRTFRETNGRCHALAMRDTDVDFTSVILTRPETGITKPSEVRGRTLAVGSRDSGHAAILPIHFLEQEGLHPGRDYHLRRFDLDVGKHGDTGNSEQAVLQAVASGEVEAGAVGDPFWAGVLQARAVDPARVRAIWTSPAYHHCNFTVLQTDDRLQAWTQRLLEMDYNRPADRRLLDLEGLKRWVSGRTEGYRTLFDAVEAQNVFGEARVS